MGDHLKWATPSADRGADSRASGYVAERNCPICGSASRRTVLVVDGFQYFSDSSEVAKRIDVRDVQCLDCGAIFRDPALTASGVGALLSAADQSYGASEGRAVEQVAWMAARGLLPSGTTVLDAGCYEGGFLTALPPDVKAVGVDSCVHAIARGRAKAGGDRLEFVIGELDAFSYEGSIGVITMTMVLEHVTEPVAVLRRLRMVAGSDTRLLVEVPLLENGSTDDVCGFFSAFHSTHFSRASLRNCLLRAGWECVEWFEHADYNGCRVVAVPREPVDVVVASSGDIALAHACLAEWHRSCERVEALISLAVGDHKCVVWGGGAHTEMLSHATSLFDTKQRQFIIVDSDPLKQGTEWRGIPIHRPAVLGEVDWGGAVLVVSSYGSQLEMARAAEDMGVPADRIVTLYENVRIH